MPNQFHFTPNTASNKQNKSSAGDNPLPAGDSSYTLPVSVPQQQNPATWDYRTSQLGLKNEPLPSGAQGWKPDGSPDFGAGFLGWAKNMNHNIFVAEQDAFTLTRSFAGSDPFTSELFPRIAAFGAGGVKAETELLFGGLNLLALSAQTLEQISGTAGYAIKDAVNNHDAFNDPKYLEHNWNASRGVWSAVTAPLIQGVAKKIEGGISDIAKRSQEYDAIHPEYKNNVFLNPLGMLAARMVQQESFGKVALDAEQLRREFITRMNAGERPDNIAMDLQIKGKINPWSEMAGQMMFDFLNVGTIAAWGGKSARTLKNAAAAEERFMIPESKVAAEFTAQGAKNLAATGDEISSAAKFAEMSQDVQKTAQDSYDVLRVAETPSPHLKAIPGGPKLGELPSERLKIYGPLTQETRRSVLLNGSNQVMETISRVVTNPAEYLDVIEAGANMSRGGKLGEDAVAVLSQSPAFKYMVSPAGNDASALIRHLIDDNPNMLKEIRLAANEGDTAAAAAMLKEKMLTASDKMIPDAIKVLKAYDKNIANVEKMTLEEKRLADIGANMSAADRWTQRTHIAAQQGVVGKSNTAYSQIYMGLSPAYPIKNVVSNSGNMAADYGLKIFFKSGDEAIGTANKINGNILPNIEGMNSGSVAANALEATQKIDIGTTGIRDILKAAFINPETGKANKLFGFVPLDFRKASSVGEAGDARSIVGYTYVQFYRNKLTPLVDSFAKDARFSNIPKAAWQALKHELSQSGNVDEAMKAINEVLTTGVKMEFKDMNNIPQTWRDALRAAGREEEFYQKVLNASTKEEAKAELARIIDSMGVQEKGALVDPYKLDLQNPEHSFQAMGMENGDTTPAMAQLDAMLGDYQRELRGKAGAIFQQVQPTAMNLPNRNDFIAMQNTLDLNPFSEAGSAAAEKAAATLRDVGHRGVYGKVLEAKTQGLSGSEIMRQIVDKEYERVYRLLDINAPRPTSVSEFTKTLWEGRTAQVEAEWKAFNEQKLTGLVKYIDAVEQSGGVIDPRLKEAAQALVDASTQYKDVRLGFGGSLVVDHLPILKGEAQGSLIAQLAEHYGISSASKLGRPSDKHLLNIINNYNLNTTAFSDLTKDRMSLEMVSQAFAEKTKTPPLTFDDLFKMLGGDINRMVKYTEESRAAQVDQALQGMAKGTDLLAKKDSPFAFLKAQGIKINSNEFSDVMGGKFGVDKQGVPVGLFAKDGQGIDNVGRELANAGFMTQEQGADVNYVRDYLRSANKSTSTEQQLAKAAGETTGAYSPDVHAPVSAESKVEYKLKPEQPSVPPSMDRIVKNINKPLVKNALDKYIEENFNKVTQIPKDKNALNVLETLKPELNQKLTDLKLISSRVAQENRNFTILNYGHRTYGNVARAYLMPYGFWYEGQLGTWAKRAIDNPAILAGYAKYKNAMAMENAASPDWMKQNIQIDNVFGIPLKNPLFFNLEQTIWPLNGITGEDFTDPNRSANWWSYTLDQMNKFGPTTWAPINMAAGLLLRAQGNQEASDAWLGRISSQSLLLKRLTGVETDPIVGLLQGGYSPTERKQIGRELAAMVENKLITPEQAIDAARSQNGPWWEAAIKNSNANHLLGQTMSSVFGVGLKQKTQEDMQIDQFDSEYRKLMTLSKGGFVSPDDFRQQMALLGEKYPFMDTVLISRRGGPERDAALGYNVLSRIPPGAASQLFQLVGVDNNTLNQFYNDKGDMSKWTEGDRTRLTAAFVDLAAVLKMPNLPTKQEWNQAKTAYNTMRTAVEQQLGADIWTKVDTYYEAQAAGRGPDFLAANPDAQKAFNLKDAYVSNTPILSTYYGGVDVIQRYYESQARAVLSQKYGQDIYQKASQYYSAIDPAEKKRLLTPQLKKFMDEKNVWSKWVMDATVRMGTKLQDQPAVQLRDVQSTTQQNLANAVNQQKPTADQWRQQLGSPMFNLIAGTADGKPLTYTAQQNLDYIAQQMGYYDGNALMTDVLISMNK